MQTGMDVPADRSLSDTTVELVEMLGHPNPRWREDLAYPLLTNWLNNGVYDEVLSGFGDGLAPGMRHGLGNDGDLTVLRRAYSALLLAEIVGRDNNIKILPSETIIRWGDEATTWFVRERDERGWVPGHGWAHPIAHGADLLATFARSRHFGPLEQMVLLDVIGDRALTDTQYAWRHGEDDRLAFAVMALLHRNEITARQIESWLARLGAHLRPPRTRGHVDTEWPTPTVHNTLGLLRSLHLQLALGVRGRLDADGDDQLFRVHPADRADLLLAVIEQIRSHNPELFRSPPTGPR